MTIKQHVSSAEAEAITGAGSGTSPGTTQTKIDKLHRPSRPEGTGGSAADDTRLYQKEVRGVDLDTND